MNSKVNKYDHQATEDKWQEVWKNIGLNHTDLDGAKAPFYNLMMFPYPSAEGLHVGNMYAFTGSDIYGRYKRMQGNDVFEPIGLDGFGIHSENYALKIGRHPMDHAQKTQINFYKQLHKIGSMYDWSKTLETYDPNYYKWTQWLFVQMYKHGLAYRKKASVNFCPGCKTVLADEQVIDGKCERCGNIVEKRLLKQWFFRITAYAEKLQNNISALNWSEIVKTAQNNWIGKKIGINITYQVVDSENNPIGNLICFTTRPDTNYGATFVAIAPEHPFVTQILKVTDLIRRDKITKYLKDTLGKNEMDRAAEGRTKTGVDTGLYCINNLNGEKMPLYISDFVLMGFGTGVVVGVPGHDERDYDFARMMGLPIHKVVDFDGQLHLLVKKKFVPETFLTDIKSAGIYVRDFGDDYGAVAERDQAETLIRLTKSQLKSESAYAEVDGINKGLISIDGIITDLSRIDEFIRINNIARDSIWLFNQNHYKFCYTGEGRMVNSGILNGLGTQEAITKIMDYLEEKGWGKRASTYHLRDWLISRQRYWGPPIPMIYCETCAKAGKSWLNSKDASDYQKSNPSDNNNSEGTNNKNNGKQTKTVNSLDNIEAGWYPVPEADLPVLLPRIEDYKPGDDGVAPLAKHQEFYNTKCPVCGSPAVRETDVSDTFLDSSWYFLRYPSINHEPLSFIENNQDNFPMNHESGIMNQGNIKTKNVTSHDSQFIIHASNNGAEKTDANAKLPFDPKITKRWLPVNMYTGGAEHSVLHLLYSRFVTMALHDWGYLDFEEPFSNFFAHGLVIKDGAKMSKSKGNVVNPDEYIIMYGADALRMYLMFMGPFSQGGDFRDSSMEGMSRWVGRIWRMAHTTLAAGKSKTGSSGKQSNPESAKVSSELQLLINKVGDDLDRRRYNTAIASMMEFTNLVADSGRALPARELKIFLLLLAPFAPFLTEELWQALKGHEMGQITKDDSIHMQKWPQSDMSLVLTDAVILVVQINGKVRDTLKLAADIASNQSKVTEEAKKSEKISKYLGDKQIRKTIFVPGKIINFVI